MSEPQLRLCQLSSPSHNPEFAMQAVLLREREMTSGIVPDEESLRQSIAYLESPEITTFIAIEGSQVVATGGLDRSDPTDYEEASIIDLAVASDYRYMGLGRGIVKMIEATAAQEGIKNLYAFSTLYAHGFYNRLGFLRVTSVDYVKSL